jgi:dolichol-phosphate mannosyltransferase
MSRQLISIIVPTYKEARNIPVLVERIDKSMRQSDLCYEVVIVDDNSNDGIVEVIEDLKNKYNITLKVREHEKGLSSAVIAGFGIARGDIFVVMDADLSHEPERIPKLVDRVISDGSEFVIGSRFVEGGAVPHFDLYRRLNAWVSKTLARPLTKVNDPMSGFFCFPKRILNNNSRLNPLGFKIGLEILVKCAPKCASEVPIEFQKRLHGESKLSLKEQMKYLFHLKRLYEYKFRTLFEFITFSMIGSLGMCIDLSFTYVAKDIWLFPFYIARAVGFVFALTSNFLLNRRFTFANAKKGRLAKQYVSFFMTCIVGFLVNWLISVYLYYHLPFFNSHYLVASFLGVLGGLTVNFAGSKFIVFK